MTTQTMSVCVCESEREREGEREGEEKPADLGKRRDKRKRKGGEEEMLALGRGILTTTKLVPSRHSRCSYKIQFSRPFWLYSLFLSPR